ncbi:hypothetical protein FAIPA1_370058 [Frankia sp. AiPs1]|uniref:DUF397 domain-containing protein n=1 Tax=Frankia sp. AiPa1 TaxID=573492 RepID=UPI00202BA0F5|nr:DUF397 domain-containing protein [Frankia sp. AiPa1]MCL9762393.1 DUF397 domain-containing protein [Frankia sp. AiPa1]
MAPPPGDQPPRPSVDGVDLDDLIWLRSGYTPTGMYIEAAALSGGVVLRHSHDPDGTALTFTRQTWAALLNSAEDFRALI